MTHMQICLKFQLNSTLANAETATCKHDSLQLTFSEPPKPLPHFDSQDKYFSELEQCNLRRKIASGISSLLALHQVEALCVD